MYGMFTHCASGRAVAAVLGVGGATHLHVAKVYSDIQNICTKRKKCSYCATAGHPVDGAVRTVPILTAAAVQVLQDN